MIKHAPLFLKCLLVFSLCTDIALGAPAKASPQTKTSRQKAAAQVRTHAKQCLNRTVAALEAFETWAAPPTDWVVDYAANRLSRAWRRYKRSVKFTSGGRMIRKTRKPVSKRALLPTIAGLMSNPIATIRNSRREVTIPVSIVGWTIFITAPRIYLGIKQDEQEIEMAEHKLKYLPGAEEYLLPFLFEEFLRPAEVSRIVNQQDKAIELWAMASNDPARVFLPRTQDLIDEGVITEEEKVRLNQIAYQSFGQTAQELEKAKASNQPYNFPRELSKNLMRNLQAEDSPFAKKDVTQLSLIATLFWPKVPIGEHSNIHLLQRMAKANAGVNDAADVESARLKHVYQAFLKREISLTTAEVLAARIIEAPEEIEKKVVEAKEALPPDLQWVANRPDILDWSKGVNIDAFGDGQPIQFESEIEAWQFMVKDPRFQDILAALKAGQISDLAAIREFQGRVKSLNEIFELRRAKKLNEDEIKRLYARSANKLSSPLLGEAYKAVEMVLLESGLDPSRPLPVAYTCFQNTVFSWAEFYHADAQLAKNHAVDGSFHTRYAALLEKQEAELEKALKPCLEIK
ncbi:MAG: hypothetical protein AB1540_09705 [Bdellovibrionota bacterium]